MKVPKTFQLQISHMLVAFTHDIYNALDLGTLVRDTQVWSHVLLEKKQKKKNMARAISESKQHAVKVSILENKQ